MLGYYLHLSLRSLRRSPVLTALMVLSIGAAMTQRASPPLSSRSH
ncbi:hypothetical protein [Xanthomonas sp. MUS 060]|nr:hypothetical protein [Xanthomonas sp. MUS 060]